MMKKYLFTLFIILLLFISCNASILSTNGEINKPNGGSTSSDSTTTFDTSAPKNLSATKSYFEDKIVVKWNSVTGADYYTIEKASHTDPVAPSADSSSWYAIAETVTSSTYSDNMNLESNTYYSYRVTAHNLSGESGAVSSSDTGTILASPIDLDATKGTSEDNITISWTQMPNVESYEIYKSTVSSITGLDSEYVYTVNAKNGADNLYSYAVKESEKGSELYFAIKSVSATENKATISGSRYGFTFVPGAPGKPEVIVSKGTDTSKITIQFKSAGDDSDYQYIVKRSSTGSTEIDIFNMTSGYDTLPSKNSSGYYELTDDNVSENVEYTYSVIAKNDMGMSPAGTDTGYILSPIKRLALVADKSLMGYGLSITFPVGDTIDSDIYDYEVTEVYKNNSKNIYTAKASGIKTFYEVSADGSNEENEIKSVSINVINGDATTKATESNVIADIPKPVISMSATSFDKPLDSDSANANGVYPVHVKWITKATGTQIITRVSSEGLIKTIAVALDPSSENQSYDDTDTKPLVKYNYYIDTTDELGRTLGPIQYSSGAKDSYNSYASVTPSVYIDIFESVSLKPWERQSYVPSAYKKYWKESKMAIMIGYGNSSSLSTQTQALGTANDNDHFRNGAIKYNASTEGIGGQIYFTYTNFGENEYFYMNGAYEMHVNASGTGSAKSSTGGFTTEGMYPGHITLDKISVESKAFKGTYVLTLNYSDGTGSYEVAVK